MATELGQAYVQIMPSAKGIGGNIQKALNPEMTAAGSKAGGVLGLAIKGGIAAAAVGVGAVIKKAITEGAELEQSIGGIETLFKDSAGTMRKYANEAYRTVGISGNEYMKNVTSFSASLLQATGKDTEKAAKIANTAMIDMGDNANKMGTDMRDIQNAYQGFAKQNYTMLDNLKLGYGGTKTEMERLLADAEKLTGVHYDISNLADVYTAIHVIQDELGITGTTAKEAAETFSGSFNAMKAAATDVLGKIAIGEDATESIKALAESAATFVFNNFLPMLGNIIMALPSAIATFITTASGVIFDAGKRLVDKLADGSGQALPNLLKKGGEAVLKFVDAVLTNLPGIISSGKEMLLSLIKGIGGNLPGIIDTALELMGEFVKTITTNLPDIVAAGVDLIVSILKGIWDELPQIGLAVLKLIGLFVFTIIKNLPEILEAGGEIVVSLAGGILALAGYPAEKVAELMRRAKEKIASFGEKFFAAGKNIAKSIADGILSGLGEVKDAIGKVTKKVRDFLPFSPAKEGPLKDLNKLNFGGTIAESIFNAKTPVSKAMEELGRVATDSYDVEVATKVAPIDGAKIAPSGEVAAVGEGVVNGIAGILQGASNSQPITINLQLPDGKTLAEVVFDPMKGIAKQKGVSFG